MFELPDRLKAALEARLHRVPVNARHLIIASGIDFDEIMLPNGANAVLTFEGEAFRLSVSNSIGEMARNIVYAKTLAHLLLHADLFAPNTAWIDGGQGGAPVAYTAAPIGEAEEAAAINLAIEILVPTVALRESFLYHQGSVTPMAKAFGVPKGAIIKACVRTGLLDPRSVAA